MEALLQNSVDWIIWILPAIVAFCGACHLQNQIDRETEYDQDDELDYLKQSERLDGD